MIPISLKENTQFNEPIVVRLNGISYLLHPSAPGKIFQKDTNYIFEKEDFLSWGENTIYFSRPALLNKIDFDTMFKKPVSKAKTETKKNEEEPSEDELKEKTINEHAKEHIKKK